MSVTPLVRRYAAFDRKRVEDPYWFDPEMEMLRARIVPVAERIHLTPKQVDRINSLLRGGPR